MCVWNIYKFPQANLFKKKKNHEEKNQGNWRVLIKKGRY